MSVNLVSHFKTCLIPTAVKRSFALFLLLLFGVGGYGQTFYFKSKLNTADNKPIAYNIFLNIAQDGTANARITFKDPVTGKNRLIKQNYVDNNFPDNSYADSITYLMPFGSAYGEDDTPEKNFATPMFQLNKPKNEYYSLQNSKVTVLYSYNSQQWFLPTSNIVQQIFDVRTQKELLLQFYGVNEAYFRAMFDVSPPGLTTDEIGRKIFLIAIAATDDPEIGSTTLIDLENLDMIVRYLAQSKLVFNYQQLTGKNFTKKAVDDAINNLKPGPKDIVMIYYSGHGFRYNNDVSKFPRIAMVANPEQNPDAANLGLEDIYNRVLKKGALVSIVLADCCNENYGAPPPVGPVKISPEPTGTAPPPLNLTNFRALFLPKHKLSVLTSAAEKDQLAAGNDQLGGFFTHFTLAELFRSLYNDYAPGESSWTRLLSNAKEYTRRQALTAPCKGGVCDVNNRNVQHAVIKTVE